MPAEWTERIYRWRVRTGTLSALLILLLARPTWSSLAWGGAVAVLGLLIRAWAAGHLKKEKELAVSGPYRYTRNPLYLGNLFIGLGVGLAADSGWVAGLLVLYFLVFYPTIIKRERDRLARLFPNTYPGYRALVPLVFPRPTKHSAAGNSGFRWALFKQNKEYRAEAGAAALWLLFAAKILLFP
jgi:protein-S-isoprenylcysteine O-methyltransferase Ste14